MAPFSRPDLFAGVRYPVGRTCVYQLQRGLTGPQEREALALVAERFDPRGYGSPLLNGGEIFVGTAD